MKFQVHRPQFHLPVRGLGLELQMQPLVGLDLDSQYVGADILGEHQMGRSPELDHNLGAFLVQCLARTQIKWHPLPPPIVHVQAHGRIGGRP